MMAATPPSEPTRKLPTAYELKRAQFLLNKDRRTIEKLPFDSFIGGTRDHFSIKLPYRHQLYDTYEQDLGFRAAYNNYGIFHETKNAEFMKFLHDNQFFENGTRKPDSVRMNAIIEINGHIRTGKSRLALIVALLICYVSGKNPRFHIDPDHDDIEENVREFIIFPQFTSWKYLIFPQFSGFIDIYLSFGFDQSKRVLSSMMAPGSICIQDETKHMHEEGSQKELDNLENVINIASGRNCLNFIFLCPDYVDLPQVDYFLKVLGTNFTRRRTLAMLSVHQEKSKNMKYLGPCKFNVSLPRELIEWYDEFSAKIKKRVQDLAGNAKVKKGDVKSCSKTLIDAFNEIDDDEDIGYYSSKQEAFLEFADTVEVTEGWSDKLLKAAAKRACYFLGIGKGSLEDAPARKSSHPPEPVTVQKALDPKELHRAALKAFLKQNLIPDAEIIKRELAMLGDDTRRATFLQNGINATRQDIDAYFAHEITMTELKARAKLRNDLMRLALREEQIWPAMAILFKTDEEIALDTAEAERKAWLTRIEAIEARKKEPANVEATKESASPAFTGGPFVFDMEVAFADYVAAHPGDQRGVDIFNDLKDLSVQKVAAKWPNLETGKPLSTNGLKKIEARVGGWVSLKIGHAYEPHLAAEFEKLFGGKLATAPRCEGIQGKEVPDIVLDLADGSFIVYSLKARYSACTETVTMDIEDFQAEIDEWIKIADGPPARAGKLIVVYYDHNLGQRREKQIDNPRKPPSKVRLSRVTGEPEITFLY